MCKDEGHGKLENSDLTSASDPSPTEKIENYLFVHIIFQVFYEKFKPVKVRLLQVFFCIFLCTISVFFDVFFQYILCRHSPYYRKFSKPNEKSQGKCGKIESFFDHSSDYHYQGKLNPLLSSGRLTLRYAWPRTPSRKAVLRKQVRRNYFFMQALYG